MSGNEVATGKLPERSSPLPWHAGAWAQIAEQHEAGQLPHALLLAGPKHCGKSQFALALARMLLCATPNAGVNCGRCHACELSAAGSHGDFNWVSPLEPSRFIKIEQVRAAIAFTHGTASFGTRKILVFMPADCLNINGYNALLKSLEEPAPGTHIVLVCDRLHSVPATIRSRCQMLRLPGPSSDEATDWLAGKLGDQSRTEKLLQLAGGSPLMAAEMADSGSAETVLKRRHVLRAVLRGEATAPQAWNLWSHCEPQEFLQELGIELRQFLRTLPAVALRGQAGKAGFDLLDEVCGIERSVSAGANPGKQLLVDQMLSKCHRELGAVYLGDSI